jgi:YggT family protein
LQILCQVVNLYIAIIFGRIILSWFPTSRGTILGTISDFLFGLTEPVLGPIRRLIPPVGMGGMGLDLSPIIVLLGLQILVKGLILGCV